MKQVQLVGRDKYTVHAARIKLRKVAVTELEKMEEGVKEPASTLVDAGVHVIAYESMSGSLFR
nr:hypothetical protein [Candidatus Njordarchaeum guaymaensis]